MRSGFFGSTLTSAKSLPRPVILPSLLTCRHDSPASSDRYKPLGRVSTRAYSRLGSLRETSSPIRPRPSSGPGKPLVSAFQVDPPSVDLKSPLFGPLQEPFSHGAWRAAQSTAYTVCELAGSKARAAPPVFSSL